MTLQNGMRLGPYEVGAPIGAGGMGEVYRASDTRLNRVVAIKVLPHHLAADSQARERLEREARAISKLNDPHICSLYDVGNHEGIDFLVMEYLEGDTLADRLARGPMPVDEAVRLARQIARALEAAHDQGIIHRDLKPGNIKITSGGAVKVLDFGLAKMRAEAGGVDPSNSPTVMETTPGLILGTAAYMSPEQASGGEIDRSSDMWAFGCVLYEMLTARRAFDGATLTEVLANVLKTEPDWRRLPAGTPGGVRRLLRRSLQKDRRLRFRDMCDARLELDEEDDHDRGVPARRGERLMWVSALGLVVVIAGALGARALRPVPVPPETHVEINTPPTWDPWFAISPDGLKLVFTVRSTGQSQLWLRSLDSPVARPIQGTERATTPFWSPDGRSIAFVAGTRLKRLDLASGSMQTLRTDVPVPLGGAWNANGTIIFGNNPAGPIYRIPDSGGEATAATRVETPQQRGHFFPRFLPDGRHFLFFVTGSAEARGVYVGELDHLDARRLFVADGAAVYVQTGQLVFVREGQLLAQDFDPDRLTLKGDPYAIASDVPRGIVALSASATGPIAYRTPSPDSGKRQLVWVDRSGRETGKEIYADSAALGPALSHDGLRAAVYRWDGGNMDIWSYEIARRAWDKITVAPGDDITPLWSRDGTSIISGSVRKTTVVDLYRTLVGAAPDSEELLLATPEPKFPADLSPDGRFLLYDTLDPKRGFDMWALPLEGDRKPFSVVSTDFDEGIGQFSPDGNWVAYQSDKTGRAEIYLRPFPGPGADIKVSVDGGAHVRWNPKSPELFYIGSNDRLMAVKIRFVSEGKTAEPGRPEPLFPAKVSYMAGPAYRQQYVVSPSGESFIMQSVPEVPSASPITVILNWRPRDGR